jgi:hypothetical protein
MYFRPVYFPKQWKCSYSVGEETVDVIITATSRDDAKNFALFFFSNLSEKEKKKLSISKV